MDHPSKRGRPAAATIALVSFFASSLAIAQTCPRWDPGAMGDPGLENAVLALGVLPTLRISSSAGTETQSAGRQAGLESAPSRVQDARVLILSTMLATPGIGEWGFAALVEVDGRRILFDTGAYPDTVLRNARTLKVDLSNVTDVVLSHHHSDHVGGLLTLRRDLAEKNATALSRVHVASGMFAVRRSRGDSSGVNRMLALRKAYEATGGEFIVHTGSTELFPGVWLTGPVPRTHPERNWSGNAQIETEKGWVEDTIPESQSLVINTSRGLVVLSGCGHSGLINTLEYARRVVGERPIYAALGGFHLLAASDEHFQWTADKLRALGIEHFLGAHCTGIEAVYQIRRRARLDRTSCVVGAVGATFDLESGIDPLWLAR